MPQFRRSAPYHADVLLNCVIGAEIGADVCPLIVYPFRQWVYFDGRHDAVVGLVFITPVCRIALMNWTGCLCDVMTFAINYKGDSVWSSERQRSSSNSWIPLVATKDTSSDFKRGIALHALKSIIDHEVSNARKLNGTKVSNLPQPTSKQIMHNINICII